MSSIEEKNEQQANAAFWAKQPDIASLPTQVTIVSSNQCNFRCAMCPYHGDPQHIIRDKADRFPLDLVDKLQAYINTAAHFSLSGFSEAFASAYYFELLDYIVKKTNISSTRKLSVVTNASIFDEKKAAYLLELAKEIHFSIDGLDQGAYFTLRGFDLDKTMDNMRKFYALRSRLGLDNEVFYSVDSIVTPQNIASMPKFIRLFSQEMPVNRLSVFPLHVIPPAYARQWTVQRKNGGLFCYADAMITEDNVRKYSDFVDEIYAAKEKYGGGERWWRFTARCAATRKTSPPFAGTRGILFIFIRTAMWPCAAEPRIRARLWATCAAKVLRISGSKAWAARAATLRAACSPPFAGGRAAPMTRDRRYFICRCKKIQGKNHDQPTGKFGAGLQKLLGCGSGYCPLPHAP